MTPEVSIDKTSIGPETPKHQLRQYDKIKRQQGQSPDRHHLQLPQQSSSSYTYCHYYQDDSDHQQNASSSKQQSASTPSITLSSPKLTFRESLRESFRDLYVPKIWLNLRKSASEISLVLEAMRSGPSPTYLQTHGASSSPGAKDITIADNASKSTRGSAVQKRKRHNALVTWQNYSPHHLNKQFRYGN